MSDDSWKSRLDNHVRTQPHFVAKSKEELDKMYEFGYPNSDGEHQKIAEPLTPVRTGIWTKVAAPEKHLAYTTRLMKSVWISDVLQPMIVHIHGWDVQYPGMVDIYGGRNQGIPMLAKNVVDGGVVAMLDDDIVLPPRWSSTLRAIFESDPKIGAVYPLVQEEADHFIQGIDGPRHGSRDIHHWTPDKGCERGSYIHQEPGLVYLDKDKLMKTLAWRSTDMCVFYRAEMVRDFLHYNHDFFCWKIDHGWKVVLAKSFEDTVPFAVAHYKEFGERDTGTSDKQLPFFACYKCNHVCCWGEPSRNLYPYPYTCPTCNEMPRRVN